MNRARLINRAKFVTRWAIGLSLLIVILGGIALIVTAAIADPGFRDMLLALSFLVGFMVCTPVLFKLFLWSLEPDVPESNS